MADGTNESRFSLRSACYFQQYLAQSWVLPLVVDGRAPPTCAARRRATASAPGAKSCGAGGESWTRTVAFLVLVRSTESCASRSSQTSTATASPWTRFLRTSPLAVAQMPNATFVQGNPERYLLTGERPYPSIQDARTRPELLPRLVEVAHSFAWTLGAITHSGGARVARSRTGRTAHNPAGWNPSSPDACGARAQRLRPRRRHTGSQARAPSFRRVHLQLAFWRARTVVELESLARYLRLHRRWAGDQQRAPWPWDARPESWDPGAYDRNRIRSTRCSGPRLPMSLARIAQHVAFWFACVPSWPVYPGARVHTALTTLVGMTRHRVPG